MGMIDNQIGVLPGDAAVFRMIISPGEKLYNPAGTHFTHQLQRALNFPLLYLICQPGVNTNDGMDSVNGLRRTRGDEDGGGLKQSEDENEGEEAEGRGEGEGRLVNGERREERGEERVETRDWRLGTVY